MINRLINQVVFPPSVLIVARVAISQCFPDVRLRE